MTHRDWQSIDAGMEETTRNLRTAPWQTEWTKILLNSLNAPSHTTQNSGHFVVLQSSFGCFLKKWDLLYNSTTTHPHSKQVHQVTTTTMNKCTINQIVEIVYYWCLNIQQLVTCAHLTANLKVSKGFHADVLSSNLTIICSILMSTTLKPFPSE